MKKFLAVAFALLVAYPARAADVVGKQAVRSATAADLQTQITGSDGSSLAQIAASNGAAAANGVFVLGASYNSSLPTMTSGRSVSLQTDINGRLIITQDASASALLANITKIGGSALALGSTTSSASIPVVIASDQSNLPQNLKQVNGSTLSLGQTTMSASLPVAIASNQGSLSVSFGAPTGAATNRAAPVNIAAAGTTAIVCKGALAISQPLKMYQVTVSGAALARCTIRYNDNGSFTNWGDVVIGPAEPTVQYNCPSGFCGLTTSATSTTQQIEANCTNFDAAAQDFGCAVSYCQAASGC